jgi:hypothetical protein
LKMSNFWPEELRKSSRASKSCFLNGRYQLYFVFGDISMYREGSLNRLGGTASCLAVWCRSFKGEKTIFCNTKEVHKCAKPGLRVPPLSPAPALPRPHARSQVPWPAHDPGRPRESPRWHDFCSLHALPRHSTLHQANAREPAHARTSAHSAAAGAPRDACIRPTHAPAGRPHRLSCPSLSSAVRFTSASSPLLTHQAGPMQLATRLRLARTSARASGNPPTSRAHA